jgi:type I restriction enzyme R subunit
MIANGRLEIAGLYRPRREPPGFAIAVFRDVDGTLCVQEAAADGRTVRFVPCNVDAGVLHKAPLREDDSDAWTAAVGQSMIYAFHRPNGSFAIGTREAVEAAVREELLNLHSHSFTWAEAARFVHDEKSLREAEQRTRDLLRHPSWGKQKVGEFTAGESTPKHRAPAEALRLDEKNHVEEKLLEQLAELEWSVLRLDVHGQTPAETGRKDFSEVVMRDRLKMALEGNNDWLEPDQVDEVITRLTDFAGHTLIENNRQVLTWLTEGIGVAENRRTKEPSPLVRIVDFKTPSRNDWTAVSQFKLRIPGREQHIVPDVVLFLNGLPVVVFECKSPRVQEPIAEAIDQLLRYSEQRGATGEGNPALFYYNQFVVATCAQMAKFGTITTHTELHFYRWSDPWPFNLDDVAKQTHRRGTAGSPNDQARLVAGMCAQANLLSLLQSFTLFTTDSQGRMHKVVARYQQFRAVHRTLERLTNGETAAQRGGIVWHTQGSGKSLTMVFVVRAMRRRTALQDWKVVFVTDRTQLEQQLGETSQSIGQTVLSAEWIRPKNDQPGRSLFELLRDPSSNCVMAMIQKFQEHDLKEIFPRLNPSPKILVMVDEAHRTEYGLLGANLERALPNATRVAYTGTPIENTVRTFGAYIDYYTMRQAQDDGVTLQIVYEGRTHSAAVSDAQAMDVKFADVFSEYQLDQRLKILGFGTRGAYLNALPTIKAKARDMVRHYARNVFPGGYKAQVVANSRIAAVRYAKKLKDAIATEAISLSQDDPLRVNADDLRAVEVALVITWQNNDDAEIKDAMRGVDVETVIKRFKMPFEAEDEAGEQKLNGRVGFVVVNEMLVTGFDAPLEQVLYLDRVVRNHTLLQAVARVNRVHDEGKDCGFVVDYVGVGNNLRKALDAYAAREQQEVIECLTPTDELIGGLKQALDVTLALLAQNGVSETTESEAFYDLFYDEDIRFEYLTAFRRLTHAFNKALPRAEALDYFKTYQRLAAINEMASQFLKDERLSMKGVPRKLRGIIDEFLVSEGIVQKVAPISVLDPDFHKQTDKHDRPKTRAAELEHAIRHHIAVNYDEDPELFASMAKELERILQEYAGNWDLIAQEMENLRRKLMTLEQQETHGLDRKRQMPIFRALRAELFGDVALSDEQTAQLVNLTQLLLLGIQTEIRQAGFWSAPLKQNRLRGELQKILLGREHFGIGAMTEKYSAVLARLMEWARRNDKVIRRP